MSKCIELYSIYVVLQYRYILIYCDSSAAHTSGAGLEATSLGVKLHQIVIAVDSCIWCIYAQLYKSNHCAQTDKKFGSTLVLDASSNYSIRRRLDSSTLVG